MRPDDRVDGERSTRPEDVSKLIGRHRPGTTVALTVVRAGRTLTVKVPVDRVQGSASSASSAAAAIRLPGRRADRHKRDRRSVGGARDGARDLDKLTPGDLTGGKKVAVTGTIADDGTVGEIGGIQQKAIAAKAARRPSVHRARVHRRHRGQRKSCGGRSAPAAASRSCRSRRSIRRSRVRAKPAASREQRAASDEPEQRRRAFTIMPADSDRADASGSQLGVRWLRPSGGTADQSTPRLSPEEVGPRVPVRRSGATPRPRCVRTCGASPKSSVGTRAGDRNCSTRSTSSKSSCARRGRSTSSSCSTCSVRRRHGCSAPAEAPRTSAESGGASSDDMEERTAEAHRLRTDATRPLGAAGGRSSAAEIVGEAEERAAEIRAANEVYRRARQRADQKPRRSSKPRAARTRDARRSQVDA